MLCFVCADACLMMVGLFTNTNYYLEGNSSPLIVVKTMLFAYFDPVNLRPVFTCPKSPRLNVTPVFLPYHIFGKFPCLGRRCG